MHNRRGRKNNIEQMKNYFKGRGNRLAADNCWLERFRMDMNHLTGAKAPGLRWVKSAPWGRCGTCPMQRHRAAHRAKYPTWPENRFVPIKLIHISPEPL